MAGCARRRYVILTEVFFARRCDHRNAVERDLQKLFERQIPESPVPLIAWITAALSGIENLLDPLVARLRFRFIVLRFVCHDKFTPHLKRWFYSERVFVHLPNFARKAQARRL